ncbi:MAG: hypothetical protein KatS3mg083_608 [Candidatus Dojkabacteria bacterium]|nr:MAG: hypothetical protein KatS3mg083_608 [Candidatus Dojkabacteria bacterium]
MNPYSSFSRESKKEVLSYTMLYVVVVYWAVISLFTYLAYYWLPYEVYMKIDEMLADVVYRFQILTLIKDERYSNLITMWLAMYWLGVVFLCVCMILELLRLAIFKIEDRIMRKKDEREGTIQTRTK